MSENILTKIFIESLVKRPESLLVTCDDDTFKYKATVSLLQDINFALEENVIIVDD